VLCDATARPLIHNGIEARDADGGLAATGVDIWLLDWWIEYIAHPKAWTQRRRGAELESSLCGFCSSGRSA
jgi:hypothetical protein